MSKTRRHLAATACVLLLNLQLFAANALGCAHQSIADATVASCPHLNGSVAAAPGGIEPLPGASVDDAVRSTAGEPCQKCNLVKVAGGWHLVSPQLPEVAHDGAALPQAHLILRPSATTPDGLLRPPRPISG